MISYAEYVNYKDWAVRYNTEDGTFSAFYAPVGCVVAGGGIEGFYRSGKRLCTPADYPERTCRHEESMGRQILCVFYRGGPSVQPGVDVSFTLNNRGLTVKVFAREALEARLTGDLCWGMNAERDTFAVSLNRSGCDLRAALGPAADAEADTLFDRQTDRALTFSGAPSFRLGYCWERNTWQFTASLGADVTYTNHLALRVKTDVVSGLYNMPYKPINKHNTFPTPPAGFMTWYALKFDTDEARLLANADWQAQHLKDYGATAVWVDWEWYHNDHSGLGTAGVDTFHPDPNRYPHGLKAVAEHLKREGLIPALWVGFTNDPTENEFIRQHPETVLAQDPTWCGQYFFDITHPLYLTEFLPRAFRQLKAWGYEALKWDCFPPTLYILDRCHEKLTRSDLSTEEAIRSAVAAARQEMGDGFYMMSCSGITDRDITMAADLFDGARIGNDVFLWEEFIREAVNRVMIFYSLHNTVLYNDPDNLVLREQYSTYDQAVSRASFVSLAGLPMTLGDDLTALPEDRVDILRRTLPPVDAHPMDLRRAAADRQLLVTTLSVSRPFEEWTVANVLNLSDEARTVTLSVAGDLHLFPGSYLVYDYWNDAFLGTTDDRLSLDLRPSACRVLSLRRLSDHPQLLSTSRHITQGAVELRDVCWDDASGTLSGISQGMAGVPYTVSVYLPEGWHPAGASVSEDSPVFRLTLTPDSTGPCAWSAVFTKS